MIYTGKAAKISIYINTERKTIAQVKAETGCTAIINGGLYDMLTFEPVCHLKAGGAVLAADEYKYWGFAWDVNALHMVSDYTGYSNYICRVCLVRNGKAERIIDNSQLKGSRRRTALGVFPDGAVWLYAADELLTVEELQNMALAAGLEHAVMLDGGGSTQCIFPEGAVSSARRVHNFICVWAEQQEDKGGAEAMFRIALGAGHGINTAGKRCLKTLDPNETREWWLNDRVCDYVESYLKKYEGYELLRVDDSDDGADNIELEARTKAANAWGADVYLSVHHNAGANGTSAGGIVAFSYKETGEGAEWRDDLYAALIKHTGLKGNRYDPTTTGNFHVLRETAMPAVLLELGFMDSKTDVPVILTDEFAQQCARAIVEVIAKRGNLKQKAAAAKAVYKVQLGAFGNKGNAERLAAELKAAGYQVYITQV